MSDLLGFGLNAFNTLSQIHTKNQQMALSREQFDWVKAVTQQQWERDDTAHQREVADLKAAGLSPLANTTGSPVTSAPSAPTPMSFQAPQFDINSLIQSSLQNKALNEEERHNRELEQQGSSNIFLHSQEIANELEAIQTRNKELQETIDYHKYMVNLQAQANAEVERSHKADEALNKAAYLSKEEERQIKLQTGDENIPVKRIYGKDYYDYYVTLKKMWDIRAAQKLKQMGAQEYSYSGGVSGSYNANASVGVPGANGSAGSGGSLHIDGSVSKNFTQKQKEEWNQYLRDDPMPVFLIEDKPYEEWGR